MSDVSDGRLLRQLILTRENESKNKGCAGNKTKGNLREVVKVYNWQMIGCVGNKEEGIDESELLCEQENGGGDAPGNGKRFGRFGHSKLSTSKHCIFRDSFTEWLLS